MVSLLRLAFLNERSVSYKKTRPTKTGSRRMIKMNRLTTKARWPLTEKEKERKLWSHLQTLISKKSDTPTYMDWSFLTGLAYGKQTNNNSENRPEDSPPGDFCVYGKISTSPSGRSFFGRDVDHRTCSFLQTCVWQSKSAIVFIKSDLCIYMGQAKRFALYSPPIGKKSRKKQNFLMLMVFPLLKSIQKCLIPNR